ncbi:MAG: hypothetical protein H6868_02910 [Rhodospirillales bacterium]|nr:hypothetical protein [Rhodospirillales bacterium]
MKKFLAIAGLIILTGAAVAYAMGETAGNKSYSWRYKMTVTVETPEGLKSGSAVRQIDIKIEPRPGYRPHPYYASHKMKGEAVVVDLGKRGLLFAITSSDSYPEVTDTFKGPSLFTIEGGEYYSKLKGVKAPVLPKDMPWMVHFTDLNNPLTVEIVKGNVFDIKQQKGVPVDDFERVFGEGVKLHSVTVEMTDEPVTWGIEQVLPWLSELKGGYLDGGFTSRNAPYGLYGGNFTMGEKQ